MRVVYGLDNLERPELPVVITIGNFDGVHRGHQAIVRRVVELARAHRMLPVVMTFEFHPLKVLSPKLAPGLLMPLDQRLEIWKAMGVELVAVARCVPSLLGMDRETFVREVLTRLVDLRFVVEGPNFRFGCDRSGDIDYLIAVGPRFGFQAVKIEPERVDLGPAGVKMVSSSLIRRLISSGQVDLARRCLGRPYRLFGTVIKGTKRGRTLGFPTANLDVGEQVLPDNGIYAATTRIDAEEFPSAAVVGPAPTFEQYQVAVEAFLIGYTGADLYGKRLTLSFYRRVRDIIKFEGTSELVRQIDRDVQMVRDILKHEGDF